MSGPNAHRHRDAAGTAGSGTGTGTRLLARLRYRERWLWGLVVVGLVADTALTLYGLQQGLAEANPVVRSAMHQFGPVGGLLVIKGGALGAALVIYEATRRRLAPIVPTVIGVMWMVAGVVNVVNVLAL